MLGFADAHDAWLLDLFPIRYTGVVAADAHNAWLWRSHTKERSQLMLMMGGCVVFIRYAATV